MKKKYLEEIYRILVIHLGAPPRTVQWVYKSKDGKVGEIKGVTPQQFYDKYVRKHLDVSQMVSIVHDPRNEYYKLYTVDRLMNVSGGLRPRVLYINLPVDKLKEYSVKQLQNGRSVWFGCHVGEFFERERGVMDLQQHDYRLVFGVDFAMNKAQRLQFGQSLMTHAMVFTGVHLGEDKKPVRWRVENSWGDKKGDKGYCLMTDDWFSEYNYQICLDKNMLPKDVLDVLKQEPKVLPAWDPMGALAQ
jgi:bleomycin hydrolase